MRRLLVMGALLLCALVLSLVRPVTASPAFIEASHVPYPLSDPQWIVRISASGGVQLTYFKNDKPHHLTTTLSPAAMKRLRDVIQKQQFATIKSLHSGKVGGDSETLIIGGHQVGLSPIGYFVASPDSSPEIRKEWENADRFRAVFKAVRDELPKNGAWIPPHGP